MRIQRALERQALRKRASLLERGLTPPDLGSSFIGESPEFRRVLQLIDRVGADRFGGADHRARRGSGKEMVAKLHARAQPAQAAARSWWSNARRCRRALLQSELFGHERGAFTGADRAKPGLFEVAHGGTIFLDEIGEISLATQVKLLRVLDTSTFRHVGRHTGDPRGCARAGRDQSRSPGDGAAGAVPRRPLLPAEHHHGCAAAAARAPRATSTCWPAISSRC